MYRKRFEEIRNDPGRGGCGILAIADLDAPPSHELIIEALEGLKRMEHRGGSLGGTGDGAGLLIKTERTFFEPFITPGRQLASHKEPLIVGTAFFLHGEQNIAPLQREIDLILRREGLMPMGWRRVPIDESTLGARALEDIPRIYQLLAAKGHRRESTLREALHQTKIIIERELAGLVSITSLAPYTTVYKALATADQLVNFYHDFSDQRFISSVAVGHRRFSTNTFSNWNLVQPLRHIAHNGEINTIKANTRAIRDASSALHMPNTLMSHGSDSAQVDRVAEMMAANGMVGIDEALRRMMPPAKTEYETDEAQRTFFEANRRALGTLGAWEGPIAIVGTDGKIVVAILDRMGLRPLRYVRTKSGRLVISSEIGAVPVDPANIIDDGQLEPGGMIAADLTTGTFIPAEQTTSWIMDRTRLNFRGLATVDLMTIGSKTREIHLSTSALNAFGWTHERIARLEKTAKHGKEPVIGMGNDMPLAIFSENHPRLYSYLHQIVAVVTNPPIDSLREDDAIDTTVYLGKSPRLTKRSKYKSYPQYELSHPVLSNEAIEALYTANDPNILVHKLDATFADRGKPRDLVRCIHHITDEALATIRSKHGSILVVSDYGATTSDRLPLPMLLVINAIHRKLSEAGLRRDTSIVVETGEVHEAHDLAILLAYGATAVNPYAMYALAHDKSENLTAALVSALRRVMSKMGITTIAGYRGSALFEAIGISSDVVEYFIPDTVSRLGGVTIENIYNDIVARCSKSPEELEHNRNISIYRREVTDALQLVARNGNEHGDYDRFIGLLEETPPVYLRDMLSFPFTRQRFSGGQPPSIEKTDVIPAHDIIKTTFSAAGMSHGALNVIAHRAIAAAFNHFGASSCSGEGGEDERRNRGNQWESDRSAIRQIASGRFGVDASYLVNADEIEIKIGQGAKPGEGGHLPGHKVTEEIARIRKTKAGVDLISPPPHHDIYSIEDLAQLISNIKALNPHARVSVKVPSITGLGTIAVGIAKAGADCIVISGYSGGTGAASSGSIAHAGLPLERGVSESHQFLNASGVREIIRIRADGGIKSGLDAAKIIALGANEVAIGTPLLIAECCVFCRGCNKGSCPVGIATQDKKRQDERFMRRFVRGDETGAGGDADRYDEAKHGVINYLTCVAEHLRNILSQLGLTQPRDLVGRVDLLHQIETDNPRWNNLDLSELLMDVGKQRSAYLHERRTNPIDINNVITLSNSDHAIGATIAGEIATRRFAEHDRPITIEATGYAGQGFAFGATTGMTIKLTGYANDTVAEIMSGTARVVITPPDPSERLHHLIGNAAAYGATGGTLYIAGSVGQRFGVRNSGATLVCEGAGKYAFEYMTGGTGVVLGRCGACIGSGMTGGELFLHDPDHDARTKLHLDVTAHDITPESTQEQALKNVLGDFFEETKSPRAAEILQNWQESLPHFIHVTPR